MPQDRCSWRFEMTTAASSVLCWSLIFRVCRTRRFGERTTSRCAKLVIYHYEISIDATNVEVEPRELFDPDDSSCTRGGCVPVQPLGVSGSESLIARRG